MAKHVEYIDIPDFWRHINLRKKKKDIPDIGVDVLFAEYSSEHKCFYKFVGRLNKQGYIEYPSGKWKLLKDTGSKLYWSILPCDPDIPM